MAIEETGQNHPAEADLEACPGRMIAIPMIGLGAAACCSIEFVQTHAPEMGALPGVAGSLLAMGGLLLLFRCQVRKVRKEAALKRDCLRLAPYLPEMVNGSNGAAALNAALAPVETVVRTSAPRAVADMRAPVRQQRPRAEQCVSSVTPFHPAPERPATRRTNGAPATVYAAMRLGGEWAQDLDLSPRAQARLEADPFVKRLARLS